MAVRLPCSAFEFSNDVREHLLNALAHGSTKRLPSNVAPGFLTEGVNWWLIAVLSQVAPLASGSTADGFSFSFVPATIVRMHHLNITCSTWTPRLSFALKTIHQSVVEWR